MKDETFGAIVGIIVMSFMIFFLVFLPVRAVISRPNYNYTDYCVDRFGETFLPTNHERSDLMKCYTIEDGDMVEKVFRMSLVHESATCKNKIGFWELNKWKVTYCNWEGLKRDLIYYNDGEKSRYWYNNGTRRPYILNDALVSGEEQ